MRSAPPPLPALTLVVPEPEPEPEPLSEAVEPADADAGAEAEGLADAVEPPANLNDVLVKYFLSTVAATMKQVSPALQVPVLPCLPSMSLMVEVNLPSAPAVPWPPRSVAHLFVSVRLSHSKKKTLAPGATPVPLTVTVLLLVTPVEGVTETVPAAMATPGAITTKAAAAAGTAMVANLTKMVPSNWMWCRESTWLLLSNVHVSHKILGVRLQ